MSAMHACMRACMCACVHVCVWVGSRMKRKAKEHQGMLRIQWMERKTESRRGRGVWHYSSLSDGSSSGLRHGLPLISLSLDMKLRRKRQRGGWLRGPNKKPLPLLVPDWFLLWIACILRRTIKLTCLLIRTRCSREKQKWWVVTHIREAFIWAALVPTHEIL